MACFDYVQTCDWGLDAAIWSRHFPGVGQVVKVCVAQGLVADHAPLLIAANYDGM